MAEFAQTTKQVEIVELVLRAAAAGKILSFAELRAGLSYANHVSKQAILCSLRTLDEHGVLQRVYGPEHGPFKKGAVMYVKPTPACFERFRR